MRKPSNCIADASATSRVTSRMPEGRASRRTSTSPYQPRFRPGDPWPARARSKTTTLADGTAMHGWHLERPGAPVVVAVHGLGAASEVHVPIATVLATHFSVHLPDLPGYGRTPGDGYLDPSQLADALAAWMRALRLPPAVLIGVSAGCQTLLHFAVRHRDLVDRLVLQAPTVDERARTRRQQIGRLCLDAVLEHPTLVAVQSVGVRQAGARRLWRFLDQIIDDRPEDLLADVECPVLVVRGGRDPIVPRRWAATVAHLAPQGRLVEVARGAHTLVYSRPRQFAAAIRPFLGAAGRLHPT